jgi:hypothetical protein
MWRCFELQGVLVAGAALALALQLPALLVRG